MLSMLAKLCSKMLYKFCILSLQVESFLAKRNIQMFVTQVNILFKIY